jgi:hypothetical protein
MLHQLRDKIGGLIGVKADLNPRKHLSDAEDVFLDPREINHRAVSDDDLAGLLPCLIVRVLRVGDGIFRQVIAAKFNESAIIVFDDQLQGGNVRFAGKVQAEPGRNPRSTFAG